MSNFLKKMSPARRRVIVVVVVVAAAIVCVVAPLLLSSNNNHDLSMVLTYTTIGLGLNLLIGYTGQVSLGHTAFVAVGAYAVGISAESGVPVLLAIPVAGVLCFIIGYLVGLPSLRLGGLQLSLVTLALALLTPAAIIRLGTLTHGSSGMSIPSLDGLPSMGLASDQTTFYLCLIVAVLLYLVMRRLTRGRVGRSLIAVRENEVLATTLGIRGSLVKTAVFGISAAYAGIGGALYGLTVQFIGPQSFGLGMMISFLALIVVGGLGRIAGALLGAIFIYYAPSVTASTGQSAAGLLYGICLLVVVFVFPGGVASLAAVIRPIVARRRRDRTDV